MAAVLGGLGAAVIWAVGSIGAARAARGLGPMLTLAWVMLIGLVLTALLLPFSRTVSPSWSALAWLLLGGAGNVGGLLLMYRALRVGRMGVVMPIVTTEGGIAAAISILAGQTVGVVRGVALAATMLGVAMTGISRRPAQDGSGQGDRGAAGWAALGALAFGAGLYGTGRAGAVLPAAWAVLPPRVVGVVAVTLPLAFAGRLRRPGACARWLALSGVCEVGGFLAYTAGARHGIAVAAVLATLTGAFGTALGRVLYGERLHASQLAGVALLLVSVAVLSAQSA